MHGCIVGYIRAAESAKGNIRCISRLASLISLVRSHAEIKALISWQPSAAPNWHRRRYCSFVRSHERPLADAIEGRKQGYAHHINS